MKPGSEGMWETPEGREAIQRVISRGTFYWSQNIYRYFHRGSGRLARACRITFQGGVFAVSMAPLYDGATDYGNIIIRGIPAGEGAYNPEKGGRGHTGTYPGVSPGKYWMPWLREFETILDGIIKEELQWAVEKHLQRLVRT